MPIPGVGTLWDLVGGAKRFRRYFEGCSRYAKLNKQCWAFVSYRTLPCRAVEGFEGKGSVAVKSLIVIGVTMHANQTDKVPVLVDISTFGTAASGIRSR